MRTVSTRAIAILIVGVVVSLVGSQVPAGTIYQTDFSDTPTGELPAGWSMADSFGTWKVDVNDELIVNPVSDDSVALCPVGALTDFTVSATFHFLSAGRAGVVGRVVDADTFYSLRVRHVRSKPTLQLYWQDGKDYQQLGGNIVLNPAYVYGDPCTMSLTFEGSNITGEVRNASDVLMASVVVTDDRIASGTAGVRANHTSYGCSEFQIVPEPGAVVLLISALAGLLIVRRKR